jgi:hypothetical protein
MGAYSAIVKVQETDVWAEDEYGKTIAQGKAGVDDASVIQSAIDAVGALGGGAIVVKTPDTPYLQTDWIDIDKDNIVLEFETKLAKNGEPIFKVADNANVGGIRIGHNIHCENVVVKNFGFDGNYANQDPAVKRLHGITVEDAKHVTIDSCYITRTSPYHEHNTGGSGIFLYHQSSFVKVRNCETYDVGDRSIQLAGNNHIIENNYLHDGFDRAISLDVVEPDGTYYGASYSLIKGNIMHDMIEGSLIKGVYGNPFYNRIIGNIGYGNHKAGIGYCGHNLVIAHNMMIGTDAAVYGEKFGVQASPYSTVVGNWIYDYGDYGIYAGNNATIVGNYIQDCTDYGIYVVNYNHVIANNYINGGTYGIYITDNGDDVDIRENYIINTTTPIFKSAGATGVTIKDNRGYATENSGTATFSGDVATTQFTIAHGLVSTPTNVHVTPKSADASGDFYVTVDATNIYVNYLTAPPSGTDNVVLDWRAEV